jgi:hypothetical protein
LNSNEPTTLDYITLVIAVLGFGLAVASLAWQVVQFILTGSRVKVFTILESWPEKTPIGVRARNVGRMGVAVTEVGFEPHGGFKSGDRLWRVILNGPLLPHTLEPGQEATWTFNEAEHRAFLVDKEGRDARAYADLATGGRVVAKRHEYL